MIFNFCFNFIKTNMNSYQDIKSIKLEFIAKQSNRQKKFGFSPKIHNFTEYVCLIPLKLPQEFPTDYNNWYKSTIKNNSKIIIDIENKNYIISSSSNNQKFHKYLVIGIIKYITNNKSTIFEQTPILAKKKPVVFEKNIFNEDLLLIKHWLNTGVDYNILIDFLTNLKVLNPKAQFLTAHFPDSLCLNFNFDLLTLEIDELIIKINGFLDYLYNTEEDTEENTESNGECILKDFTLTFSMLKDANISKLIKSTSDLKAELNFKYNDTIWKDYLLSLGIYGIKLLHNKDYLNEFCEEIEDYLHRKTNEDEETYNIRQYIIKKLYKNIITSDISIDDVSLFSSIILNSDDKNSQFLVKRAMFCINSNKILKNYANFNNPTKYINNFIKKHRMFFSRYQQENEYSGYYAEEVKKLIT